MIKVTLPDNSVREYESGTTSWDVAKSISEGLARNVLAAKVNGEVWDLTRPLIGDSSVSLLSFKDKEGKATMWHSSAHLMAEAIEFHYPGVKLAIGPNIENGFYYDIDFMDYEFGDSDLEKIEKKIINLLALKVNTFDKKFLKLMRLNISKRKMTNTSLN